MSSAQERQAGTSGPTTGYEPAQAAYPTGGRHEHRGAVVGFTAAAATLMILGGLWAVGVGIAAISKGDVHVFTSPATGYSYHWNLTGWGWFHLIMGIVVVAAGVCVFLGQTWARILGAVLATISAIEWFFFLFYAPLWSILVIALDVFIIWALLAPRREPGQI
jgi:hypothetical protein